MTGRRAVRLRITGRVQGVWFRGWLAETADGLGLDGWVRNMPDGSVEALVAGPPDKVAEIVRLAHSGPPHARVAGVETRPAPLPSQSGFTVRR